MECCQNKNILKDKEMYFCKNCATIHGYIWIEYDFKFNEYNENIYNIMINIYNINIYSIKM